MGRVAAATRWPEARATRGVVASPHALASEAGLAIFRRGGNAVDAAIAAAATVAVVYPHMNGVGGDNVWLIYDAGRARLRAYKEAEEAFKLTDRPLDKFTAAYTMAYSLAYMPNRDNHAMLEKLTEARRWYLQLAGASVDSWRYLLLNDTLKGVVEADPAFKPLLTAS